MSTSRVGSVFAPNCCENPSDCTICSGKYHALTPMEQKRVLATVTHDPTKSSSPPRKSKPLTPEQIQKIKERYQQKSKPIKLRTIHWDHFLTADELKDIDRKVERAYERHQFKPGMLIDVNGQDDEATTKKKDNDAAAILLAMKKGTETE